MIRTLGAQHPLHLLDGGFDVGVGLHLVDALGRSALHHSLRDALGLAHRPAVGHGLLGNLPLEFRGG